MNDYTTKILIAVKNRGYGVKIASGLRDRDVQTSVCFADNDLNLKKYDMLITDTPECIPDNCCIQVMLLTRERGILDYDNDVLRISVDIGIDGICSLTALCMNSVKRAEIAATKILRSLGMCTVLSGYRYMRTAIMCCTRDPELISDMARLYEVVGSVHGVKPDNVKRTIKNAIETAYNEAPEKLCKFSINGEKPRNSALIAMAADTIMVWCNASRRVWCVYVCTCGQIVWTNPEKVLLLRKNMVI